MKNHTVAFYIIGFGGCLLAAGTNIWVGLGVFFLSIGQLIGMGKA